ncbi:hypothetical protein FVEN_g10471 [Fusarium venenatum]|uniref:Uncharacterized protein n=1 Tax=Fusarium venenatum TaxID=56646 RepID=A0A2L2T018_9HYPO|nr:uncharacterized protein FVRRES_11934 [Fusarium venenatum]KAG8351437.1 hypothetical protein FVEN_g10471 [Fusarium venenatum]CEI39243.1 unnamed protein product [Fusarium venenatum]
MMHPLFGVQPAGSLPVTYPHDVTLDDYTQQMACPQTSRRYSRSSNGQRPGGTAMRVAKPSSANNSPRSSSLMARRKTLMNDGNSQRRQQQIMEQLSSFCDIESQQPYQRPSRPVSWHPSSYGQTSTQQQMPTLAPSYSPVGQQDLYGNYSHYSPMMSSTSCGTSPLAFSHLPLPYQSADNMAYNPYQGTCMSQHSPAASLATDACSMPATSAPVETAYSHGWDWNNFIMHGFGSTTPPTPETLPQSQLSQPAVSEDIQYQALDDASEEEGEILVGMGLYDAPEKFNEDPQLNNYRSTVSSLLGSSFRGYEPSGKGLKLEETWEPPKSDDEEEEEEEEDDDDEEEEDEE